MWSRPTGAFRHTNMSGQQAKTGMFANFPAHRGPLIAIVINTAFFLWAAAANRHPILYEDSFGYRNGTVELWNFVQSVVTYLFDPSTKLQWVSSGRSKTYDLFLMGVGTHLSAWTGVIAQSFLASFVVLMVVRCMALEPIARWAIVLGAALAALTSLPWIAGFLMPDIFTGLLILSLGVIAVGASRLSPIATVAMGLVAALAVASHASHIALGCTLLLCVLLMKLSNAWRSSVNLLLPVSAVLVGWITAVVMGYVLLGVISWTGTRNTPLFLLARGIADGPVRQYLAEKCPQENWALCAHQHELNDDHNDFLWNTARPWHRPSERDLRQAIRNEANSLLYVTFRTHGWKMAGKFLANGARQLYTATPEVISFARVESQLDTYHRFYPALFRADPNVIERIHWSGQGRANSDYLLPTLLLQASAIVALIALVAICLRPSWRQRAARVTEGRFWPLVVIMAVGLIANAWITGGLSGVNGRYQARVIWLLPFAAMLAVAILWASRSATGRR